MRNTNTLILEVDGKEVTLDIDTDTSIVDMDQDMIDIAPLIAWYGRLLAASRQGADCAENDYRHWKAIVMEEIQATSGGKLAEWKVKAAAEADPRFAEHKQNIATAWEVANRLDSAMTALKIKADMLRSRGAMLRAEWDNTGMATLEDKVVAAKRALKGA